MSSDICREWMGSGLPVQIAGKNYWPRSHAKHPDLPLVVGRCQAETIMLRDEHGVGFVLKVFRPGYRPEMPYLQAVPGLLPQHKAFRVGRERILVAADQVTAPPRTWANALLNLVSGALLMPSAVGLDWAAVGDDIRSGALKLAPQQRLQLARDLSEVVDSLETVGCAHRDLSSGNVFIDLNDLSSALIDYDSVYHARLAMPIATTCGTEGYAAPFVTAADPRASWDPLADRFSLAVLVIEFLAMDVGSPVGADGGLFSQNDVRNPSSPGMQRTLRRIAPTHPAAVTLFERALRARRFSDCPRPSEWIALCTKGLGSTISTRPAPSEWVVDFADVLGRRQSRNAPLLAPVCVALPDDPWRK